MDRSNFGRDQTAKVGQVSERGTSYRGHLFHFVVDALALGKTGIQAVDAGAAPADARNDSPDSGLRPGTAHGLPPGHRLAVTRNDSAHIVNDHPGGTGSWPLCRWPQTSEPGRTHWSRFYETVSAESYG
jgi:hypothetical protein